jgi:hypothetical protein
MSGDIPRNSRVPLRHLDADGILAKERKELN